MKSYNLIYSGITIPNQE